MKKTLLLMAVAMLLTSAAPAHATYWGGNWGNHDWGNHDWGDWGNHDWGDDWWNKDDEPKDEYVCDWHDWFDGWDDIVWKRRGDSDNNRLLGDRNWWKNENNNRNWPSHDEIKEWLDNHDWKRDGHHGGKWHCKPKEDPIPEPATAGLAFMGVGALALATRRRRK